MMMLARSALIPVALSSLLTVGLSGGVATTVAAAPDATGAAKCAAFNDPIYQTVKPSNAASLLTPSKREAEGSAKYGFTANKGVLFKASTVPGPGLVAVSRLHRRVAEDFLFTKGSAEIASAAAHGYQNKGRSFYVAARGADCLVPIQRFRKGNKHRLAHDADRAGLKKSGWKYEGVAFYAAPARPADPDAGKPAPPKPSTAGGKFTFAVIPDTQVEVLRSTDPRMVNRNLWLAKQKVSFVTQTGDLVNWDTDDHAQMKKAKTGMNVLRDAGIPYTIAVGNHDTMATGVGGSARDPKRTYQLQRDTSTFNAFFKASDFTRVGGVFQAGKVDNVYTTYQAGGRKWMVLTLEFCARPAVVKWAKSVVASHPDHNVLISTHSYQSGNGGIDRSNQGYGDTSGQQLFNQLVSQYPNVKMVFSGHVGKAAKARVDTGVKGNKIYSFLTTMHEATSNPVRMIEVDPAAGTVKTYIYAPSNNKTWTQYSQTLTGVTFVK